MKTFGSGALIGAMALGLALAPADAVARGSSAQSTREALAGDGGQFRSTPPGRAFIACAGAAREAERGLSIEDAVRRCPEEADAAIVFNGRTIGLSDFEILPWLGQARPMFYRQARRYLRERTAAEAAGRGGFGAFR